MQLLRCWENYHGVLEANLASRFLAHPAVDEICAFPAPFELWGLKSHKKLGLLLIVLREGLDEWESAEHARKEIENRIEDERDQRIGQGVIEGSYPIHPDDLRRFYDYFCGDDGPDEKTDSSLWDDYFFGGY